jgi:hypothetical protein
VLLELTVAEQHFNAVLDVLRDGLRWSRWQSATASAAKPSVAGWAAIPPVAWAPLPTAPPPRQLPGPGGPAAST